VIFKTAFNCFKKYRDRLKNRNSFQKLVSAAREGDVESQLQLGSAYILGTGVVADHTLAAAWYEKAADQGDATAQCRLGSFYYHGIGVIRDFKEAKRYLRLAAEQGLGEAQTALGDLLLSGKVQVCKADAHRWYEKAIEQKFAPAMFRMWYPYFKGKGVARDKKKGLALFLAAVDQNYPPAARIQSEKLSVPQGKDGVSDAAEAARLHAVAEQYESSWPWFELDRPPVAARPVIYQNPEAEKLIRKAAADGDPAALEFIEGSRQPQEGNAPSPADVWYEARKGDTEAQYKLAVMFRLGLGLRRNAAKAVKWFAKAAESGHVESQYALAQILLSGEGVRPNIDAGTKWCRMASDQRHYGAMAMLGSVLTNRNLDDEESCREARKLFQSAAENGVVHAMFRLGLAYRLGTGGPVSADSALNWFRRGAVKGNRDCCMCLAEMFEAGEGVPPDQKEAAKWRRLAEGPTAPTEPQD
jgi:TPR repeat protein